MVWLVSLVLFVGLCWLLSLVLPHPPSRWHRRVTAPVRRLVRRFRRPAVPQADPFETLRLQLRLGHLAGEIRRVETTPRIYARAHRLMAVEAAYDDLLDEACRLTGVQTAPMARGEERRRFEEQELISRGWSW